MKHIMIYEGFNEITHIEGDKMNNSIPIENSRKVLGWRAKNSISKKSLAQRLDSELTTAFGKYNRIVKGEFINKVWFLSYGGINYNVYTSNKGTSIEIIGHSQDELSSGKLDNKIITFLEMLSKKI